MTEMKISGLTAVFFFTFVPYYGLAGLCDNPSPISETAYAGAYEIRFPDRFNGRFREPLHCRWRISAYRKDHIVQLEFDDVRLEKDSAQDVCLDTVLVYDGPDVTGNVIVSFCGDEEPQLMTSSREALVVFSSNKSSIGDGQFKLRYRAVKERPHSSDTSQVLRIAFGGFIGSIAFIVVCSGAFRKYKRGRSGATVSWFGRHRVRNTPSNGNRRTPASSTTTPGSRETPVVSGRAGQASSSQERRPFRLRVTGFFQGIVRKLTSRRLMLDSTNSHSSDSTNQQQQPPHTGTRGGHTSGRSVSSCGNESSNSLTNNDELDLETNSSQYALDASMIGMADGNDGHMNFGYQNIPISSFTSDPNAVRPPTYEDCVNNVNPLYLHHYGGQAFYNRACDLKSEEQDCTQTFSPPPPYSEVNQNDSSAPGIPSNEIQPSQAPPGYTATETNTPLTTHPRSEANTRTVNSLSEHSRNIGDTMTPVSITQDNTHLVASSVSSSSVFPCPPDVQIPDSWTETQKDANPETVTVNHVRYPPGLDNPKDRSENPDLAASNRTTTVTNASSTVVHQNSDQALRSHEISSNTPTITVASSGASVSPGTVMAPVALLRRSGFISSLPGDGVTSRREGIPSHSNGESLSTINEAVATPVDGPMRNSEIQLSAPSESLDRSSKDTIRLGQSNDYSGRGGDEPRTSEGQDSAQLDRNGDNTTPASNITVSES